MKSVLIMAVGIVIAITIWAIVTAVTLTRPTAPSGSNGTPVAEPLPTTSPPDTATWQTYRNEEYGFEIKFRPQWQITYLINKGYLVPPQGDGTEPADPRIATDIVINSEECTCIIRVEELEQPITIDQWAKDELESIAADSKTFITFKGVRAFEIKGGLSPGRFVYLVGLNQTEPYRMRIGLQEADNEDFAIFDAMLDTFWFVP